MIEAGCRIKLIRKALKYKLNAADGCLISHSHLDHARGIKDLLGAGVNVYASRETFKAFGLLHHHRANVLTPLEQYYIGKRQPVSEPPKKDFWTILPFPTEHDCPGSLGFVISDGKEKLLFVTDSFYLRYKVPGLNYIAIECNYSKEALAPDLEPVRKKRLLTSHFSLENVLEFLKANDLTKVREIYLLHLSSENSDEEQFKKSIQEATGIPTTVCKA